MKARARLQAATPLAAIMKCASFVIKPVAVPPAEIFGLPTANTTKGLSGGKITVFPIVCAVLR
jgi:hypothetical protein